MRQFQVGMGGEGLGDAFEDIAGLAAQRADGGGHQSGGVGFAGCSAAETLKCLRSFRMIFSSRHLQSRVLGSLSI